MANKLKQGLSTVAAGVVGAAIGAAAMFLSDKENRDKIEEGVKDLGDQASKKFEELKEKAPKILTKKTSGNKAQKRA